MRGRWLKVLMVVLVLVPVGLTAYLASNLYHRKGVPEALENLTRQLFRSKEDERKAEARAVELENYEKAAFLRDQLKSLKGLDPRPGGKKRNRPGGRENPN